MDRGHHTRRATPSFVLIALLIGVAHLVHGGQRAPAAPLPTAAVFVSSKGHDSGCVRNDRSRPCATFAKACSLARAGDVVSIADGRYPAQVVAGCAKSSPGVTFEAQTRHGVVVSGNGLQIGSRSRHSTWLRFDGVDAETFAVIGPCESDCGSTGGDYPIGDSRRTSHITLVHMKVTAHSGTGAEAPAYVDQTDYFTFEDSDVGPVCCNADGMDIYPTVSHIVLDHVDIHDIAASCSNIAPSRWPNCAGESTPYTDNHIDCLQMVGGDTVTIADSQFVNCEAGTFMNGINRQGYRNVTLVNNFFQGHVLDMTGGGGVDASGTYAFSGFVHIYYNTIPDGSDFQDWAPGGDYEIVGNIFGDIPPNHGACTIEGTHGNPDARFKIARYNMFDGGAKACGATNFNGRATLVNATDQSRGNRPASPRPVARARSRLDRRPPAFRHRRPRPAPSSCPGRRREPTRNGGDRARTLDRSRLDRRLAVRDGFVLLGNTTRGDASARAWICCPIRVVRTAPGAPQCRLRRLGESRRDLDIQRVLHDPWRPRPRRCRADPHTTWNRVAGLPPIVLLAARRRRQRLSVCGRRPGQ